MYFWNVDGLKDRLATTGLNASESLKYLIAFGFFVLCGAKSVHFGDSSSPALVMAQSVDLIAAWVIILAGTIMCYLENGGSTGVAFLERYLSLSWVVGLRVALPAIIISIVILLSFNMLAQPYPVLKEAMPVVAVVTHLSIQIAYYFRIAVHIEDVARRRDRAV